MDERNPKVLLLIGDVGGGHKAPAQALKSVFERKHPEFDVNIVDLFTEADVAPYNTSNDSYAVTSQNYTLEMVSNFLFRLFSTLPGHWGFAWYTNLRMYKASLEIVRRENPDILIANNPIVTVIVKKIKRKVGGFFSVTQVTDLGTLLRGWADHSADLVISPAPEATARLMQFGIDRKKIVDSLFPIREGLKDFAPKQKLLSELCLSSSKPVILVTGGGVGTNEHLLKAVDTLAADAEFQVVILAGKLETVKQKLKRRYRRYENVKIVGFTDRMQDYYNAANVIVAKPGTSTMLETELFGKKVVFTRKVGEQEKGNVEYALSAPQNRYMGNDWSNLHSLVRELLYSDVIPLQRRSFDEAERIVDLVVEAYKAKTSV